MMRYHEIKSIVRLIVNFFLLKHVQIHLILIISLNLCTLTFLFYLHVHCILIQLYIEEFNLIVTLKNLYQRVYVFSSWHYDYKDNLYDECQKI